MQMGNENKIDFGKFKFEFSELYLSAFSAINQQKIVGNIHQLGGLIPPM